MSNPTGGTAVEPRFGLAGGSLLLSPHADDVALSLGGLLQLDLIPRPITLVTVFGRSGFSRDEGFSADWRANTRRRRQEDLAYAESLGLKLEYLELAEAGLRPRARPLFTSGRWLRAPLELTRILERQVAAAAPGSVWIPLGLGGHRDHLLVEKAATRIARARKLDRLYYEDLPYAAAVSERRIRRRAASISRSLRPISVNIGPVLDRKIESLRLYESQICEQYLRAIHEHHGRWETNRLIERLWRSP